MSNANWYGVLNANVRYDKRLSIGARFFYAEITANFNENNACVRRECSFEKDLGVSRAQVDKWLKELKDAGYIDYGETTEYGQVIAEVEK
ncbi:MAG: helix-turn-helix domain-containing protein [Campylobacteraceae bacterium]|jgi:DNA-binding transcriptional ArsR family regulator|nr:helix-turn-helix domain-containing protein [Campylobacteraceae bacterium]